MVMLGCILCSLGLGLSELTTPSAARGSEQLRSLGEAEQRGHALTTRPSMDNGRAPGQQLRTTAGRQARAAAKHDQEQWQRFDLHKAENPPQSLTATHPSPRLQIRSVCDSMCLSADKAEQANVQQLQQENQRMCKQVETLSRDLVVLQEQLHDAEEERKHQLEYQTVLENVRSELEANHVIELVAEKEKCAAERTRVLLERAKVEQELCREREQVQALVEAMQAQAAAAEVQACAEQAQHQQVQDELHASTDKAKEELARARAAVRGLRKEVHAVRDEAMQDRQHLTTLQDRLQGKAAQFEDQAGFLEQKMEMPSQASMKPARIEPAFGGAGSVGAGVCAGASQVACRDAMYHTWWQASSWLTCLVRTSKHLAHLGVVITLGSLEQHQDSFC